MAEDMQLRHDSQQGTEQILKPGMFPQDVRLVQRYVWSFMGDEHVGIFGNAIPVFADGRSALTAKRPFLTQDGVDRRTPEVQTFQANARIFQVGGIRQVSAGQLRVTVEEQIVIAGDDQLVPEGKRAQLGIEVVYLFDCAPVKIAGVDQDVHGRQSQLAVKAVRVRHANQTKQFLSILAWLGGFSLARHRSEAAVGSTGSLFGYPLGVVPSQAGSGCPGRRCTRCPQAAAWTRE